MAASVVLDARASPGQDLHSGGNISEKTWNPLFVPLELYLREQWHWQSQQPVTLTVEVNGKRDMMKYAAVMQLVPKVGYVARLGQPGAAAKFQNLHLLDMKRRGSTDIHVSLGDLGWSQTLASGSSPPGGPARLAPVPCAASPSPDMSGNEASVLAAGGADGGLLSGSSSEGTAAVAAAAAIATDRESGTTSDSRSQADGASDQDATGTSATGPSAGVLAESRPATAGGAAKARSNGVTTVSKVQCGCAFCPCHFDVADLWAPSSSDASPYGSTAATSQVPPFKRAASSGPPPPLPAATLPGRPSSLPAPPASTSADPSALGVVTHLSRERLRDLAKLRASPPLSVCKMADGATADASRAVLHASAAAGLASAPLQRSVQSSPPAESKALDLIGCELELPAELAAKRTADKHVLVQYEIDGEMEDCKMQYRLVRSEDGGRVVLQGVSRPLRGLRLISLGENEEGDLFLRAVTPGLADAGPTTAAAAAAAAVAQPAVVAPSVAPADHGVMEAPRALGRSSSGRQRKPSLKAREGAEEPPARAASAPGAMPAGLLVPACAALAPPALSPITLPLVALPAALPPAASRRRGRPPRARPALATAAATAAAANLREQCLVASPYPVDVTMDEQMQDDQDAFHEDSQAAAFDVAAAAKRPRFSATGPLVAASSFLDMEGADERQAADASGCADEGPEESQVGPPARRGGRRSSVLPPPAPARAGSPAPAAASHRQTPSPPVTWPRCASNSGGVASARPAPAVPTTAAPSGGEASAVNGYAMDMGVDGGEGAAADAAAAACDATTAARTLAGRPSGRAGRKRASVAAAGAAAAIVPAKEAPCKRARAGATSPSGRARQQVARGQLPGAEDLAQDLALRDSPQGSEAAIGTCAGAVTSCRPRRAVREPVVDASSSSADSGDEDDSAGDGGSQSGGDVAGGAGLVASAGAAGSGGFGQGGRGGGGKAALHEGGALSQLQTAAESRSRPKPKQRSGSSKPKGKPIRHPSKITNVVRNAGAIILMIGRSPLMYEKQLRATFGNNPDTSKALRLLEEQGRVVRGGLGYRMHPYHYTLTPAGIQEYERQLADQSGPSYAFALSMGVILPPSGGADAAPAPVPAGGTVPTASAAQAQAAPGPGSGTGAAVAAGMQQPALAAPPSAGGVEGSSALGGLAQQDAGLAEQTRVAAEMSQGGDLPALAARRSQQATPLSQPYELADGQAVAGCGPLPSSSLSGSVSCAPEPQGRSSQQVPQTGCEQAAGDVAAVASAEQLHPRFHAASGAVSSAPAPAAYPTTAASGACAAQRLPTLLQWRPSTLEQPHIHPHAVQHAMQGGGMEQQGQQLGTLRPSPAASAATAAPVQGQAPAGMCAAAPQHTGPTAASGTFFSGPQPQALYAGCPPMACQLAPFPSAAYQQAAPGPVKPDPDVSQSSMPGTVHYTNTYPVYGYVPTPFGYMPYPMPYGAYPGGAAAGSQAAPGMQAVQFFVQPPPGMPAMATVTTAVQQPHVVGAVAGPYPAPVGATGPVMAPETAGAPAVHGAPQALLPPQPPLQQPTVTEALPQPPSEQHEKAPASAQPASQQQPPVLLPQPELLMQPRQQQSTLQEQQQQQQPVEQQQQLPLNASQFRFVVEMPCGSFRAEVPALNGGCLYYSPGFGSAMQAAAAADLLMTKLRPGEQLNLGFSQQEEATLGAMSVEEVQTMLWNMSHEL